MSLRLQVFLSRQGICSRRRAMDFIFAGRVTVNGQTVREPATPIDPKQDKIGVDGNEIKEKAYHYVVLNKPAGYVTTKKDPFASRTVFDLLPKDFRHLVPVGRLDKDTEGLLLLTNDGDLTYALTHPRFNIDKVYRAKIKGTLDAKDRQVLEQGIVLEPNQPRTAPAQIKVVRPTSRDCQGATEFTITIHEGRKRQIRLMIASLGKKVLELKRIAQGPLQLGDLASGHWRLLNKTEIEQLHVLSSQRRNAPIPRRGMEGAAVKISPGQRKA